VAYPGDGGGWLERVSSRVSDLEWLAATDVEAMDRSNHGTTGGWGGEEDAKRVRYGVLEWGGPRRRWRLKGPNMARGGWIAYLKILQNH